LDPAAKYLALLARVNAKNIGNEKEKRIAKGLLILQAKTLPFKIEDMLIRTDMIQLNLTDEEITDLLEKLLENPSSNDSNDKSLRFVDEIVRLKPPLNEEDA
jgi:lipid A disaccharide synthetase